MFEKVKVSREVVKAISPYKTCDGIDDLITDLHFNVFHKGSEILENVNKEIVLAVYFDNYEIEQTPEEKLLEAFNYNYGRGWGEGYVDGVQYGIKKTLDLYGIEIKGINK